MLASVDRDWASKLNRSCKNMVGSMIRRVNTQYVALVFLFTLCQVIGTTCALPYLLVAVGAGLLVEEKITCPISDSWDHHMCPPALTFVSRASDKA